MYVCMYVCTYVVMYVCMYVRSYVCMYVVMYVCMYVVMYVQTCQTTCGSRVAAVCSHTQSTRVITVGTNRIGVSDSKRTCTRNVINALSL
jgi:ABC-type xylose transport system permease subunit